MNAFRPGGEIDVPSGFAGRRREVLELVDALYTHGTCPVVYGERGLGKSSLAMQIGRIAVGDVELLDDLGTGDRALSEQNRFTVFWVSCSDETTTKRELMQRIINRAEGFSSVSAFDSRAQDSMTTTDKIDLKFYTSESKRIYSSKRFAKLGIEEQLLAVMDTLRNQGHARQLFIIDEIDRMNRSYGLASFIKNNSDRNTKFILVGIANNISSLLEDHESLERHIHPVKVPPMEVDELAEIVEKAMAPLIDANIGASFSQSAVRRLAETAAGFPWFVHLLGQDALVRAWDDGREVINGVQVAASVSKLSTNRFAQKYSDKYTAAVGESMQREIVLRVMARWRPQDIPLSEVYLIAKSLGVKNPYQYKKDLEKKKYGRIITTPQSGIIRFSNALFKRYIDLRTSIFRNSFGFDEDELISERVNRAFAERHPR